MIKEINDRRSIRRYTQKEVSDQDIKEILESTIKAPSAKNRQPWKFIVVQGESKKQMLSAFQKGLEREQFENALLPNSKSNILGASNTMHIMEQAPVTIFVMNPLGSGIFDELNQEDRIYEICNIQSLSAAIENMLLAATEKQIGSLWICDIFFAYQELSEWLAEDGELMAAVTLGYTEDQPMARPRKSLEDIVEWRR